MFSILKPALFWLTTDDSSEVKNTGLGESEFDLLTPSITGLMSAFGVDEYTKRALKQMNENHYLSQRFSTWGLRKYLENTSQYNNL